MRLYNRISIIVLMILFAQTSLCQVFEYDRNNRLLSIVFQNGNRVSYVYDELGNRISQVFDASICITNTMKFISALPGTKFQWQVKIDSASAFTPIIDNNFYFGTRIDSLVIMNPSTAMVGYKYRCAVTLDGETSYGPEYELRIKAIWKGGADSSWSNAANWECGLVPAEKIDVIIPKGMSSPVLSQDAKVESVLLKDGEVLKLAPGVKLEITGKRKE
jgi:YD repeat-containing protein